MAFRIRHKLVLSRKLFNMPNVGEAQVIPFERCEPAIKHRCCDYLQSFRCMRALGTRSARFWPCLDLLRCGKQTLDIGSLHFQDTDPSCR